VQLEIYKYPAVSVTFGKTWISASTVSRVDEGSSVVECGVLSQTAMLPLGYITLHQQVETEKQKTTPFPLH
jgi:hypothetical protein